MKSRAVIGTFLSLAGLCVLAVPSFATGGQQATPRQQKEEQVRPSAVAARQAPASTAKAAARADVPPPPMTPLQKEEMHGDVFMVRKMFEKAIETYEDVFRQVPKKNRIHRSKLLNKIGVSYQQLGNAGKAKHYYKKAAKTDRQFASPENNLGTIDFGHHNYKGAIKHFKKAVKIDPTMAAAFSNMGYAYLGRKKYKEAILSFRQAILIEPGIFENRNRAGAVVEQQGNQPPGLFYYVLAKTFAVLGNAKRCAHYLKMSRDEGYKKYVEALKDPAFKTVLGDPRVQAILVPQPPAPNSTSTKVQELQS